MPYFFLYGLAIYLLLIITPYFMTFQRLTGIAFQHPKYNLNSDQTAPDYVQQILQTPIQELELLGFQFCRYCQFEDVVGASRWSAVMQHSSDLAFALVTVNSLPDLANPETITFYTFLERTSEPNLLLITMNGMAHGIIGKIPNAIVLDDYVLQTELQWQCHKTKLEELLLHQKICSIASPDAFIEMLQIHEVNYIDSLIQSRMFIRLKGASYLNLKLWPAFTTALQNVSGHSKRMKMFKRRTASAKRTTQALTTIPVEAEVDAFHYLQMFEKVRSRRIAKLGILLVSLIAFTLSFTHLFRLTELLILVGVLFLHELGHFLAMRSFGYENTSIFFLPFFGAAASGRKDHATLAEKTLVLLAGPLPGLILGCGLAIALPSLQPHSSSAFTAISFLIVINYLNLLPLFPLDGGRIVNLLLFARYPWADLIFKGITVVLLSLLAILSLGDPILIVLAVAVGMGLPASFRSARVLHLLKRNQPFITEDEKDTELKGPQKVFAAIKQAGYDTLPYLQKYNLAKSLIQLHQEPLTRLGIRLSLIGLYSACLLGGLVGSVYSLIVAYSWRFATIPQ
jgi:Zn-dependent protease